MLNTKLESLVFFFCFSVHNVLSVSSESIEDGDSKIASESLTLHSSLNLITSGDVMALVLQD